MDPWQLFRAEIDRLFDQISGGFGMPAIRRWFDREPTWTYESTFSSPTPAVDVTEDGKAYKITAELRGLEEKDVTVTGGMLPMIHTFGARGYTDYPFYSDRATA
jgi:HSP20 family protein